MKTSILAFPEFTFDIHKGTFQREESVPLEPGSKFGKTKPSIFPLNFFGSYRESPFSYSFHMDCRSQYDFDYPTNPAGYMRVGWYLILGFGSSETPAKSHTPHWNIPEWYREENPKCRVIPVIGKSNPTLIRCQDIQLIYDVLGPWPRKFR